MTLAKPTRLLLTLWLAILLVLAFSATTTSTVVHTVRAATLANLHPALRAHVSGPASLALDPANRQSADRQQPVFYYPTSDDGCSGNLGNNIKVNQNCLNISDPDLQGRAQANNETSISYDPTNPNRVVASNNDYRRGDGSCYGAYSRDQGQSFADTTIPHSFTRGRQGNIQDPNGKPTTFDASRAYWQAGGDTSNEWDTKGNAYYSCQVFNRGSGTSTSSDQSSALLVFRSTKNGGASTNFPGRYVIAQTNAKGNPAILEDKQLITVDNHVGSKFQDRVYVAWTEFTATKNGNGAGYIYEAYSADYGETWSDKHLVSAKVGSCQFPLNPEGGCDNNQFAQPFTAPNGTLYIVYSNFNAVDYNPGSKPGDARFQVLISKSVDGGNTFDTPRKVGDYYELPDCPTYQQGKNAGRACIPEKGSTSNSIFRASNYPVGMVNPARPNEISVSYGSYINRYSNETNGCVPAGSSPDSSAGLYSGVKTPGACNNKILLSVSNDAGTTFTGTTTDPRAMTTVNTAPNQRHTDQWFQWLHYGSKTQGDNGNNGGNGDNGQSDGRSVLAVSYYDRQYGNDEVTGYSDFSLSGSNDLRHFGVQRVTSGSMPFPTQFNGTLKPPEHGVFWGDYTGLTVIGTTALPIWSDTRPLDLFICPPGNTGPPAPGPAPNNPPRVCTQVDQQTGIPSNDQDIFTARVPVPTGGEADSGGGGDQSH